MANQTLRRLCAIQGCDRPHQGRGLCGSHYSQWWRKANLDQDRERHRKYREEHPEKGRERQRKYQEAHPKRLKEKNRLYREANPDKMQALIRRWREAHPDYGKQYRAANPEKIRAKNAIRRARKMRLVCDLTPSQIDDILGRGCFLIGPDCEGPLSIAHDVALSKGGNTTQANVFCLCRRHNSRMGTKGLAEMLDQLELILR